MKTTEELINEIATCNNIYEYLKQNEAEMTELSLSNFLTEMLDRYHMTRSQVLRRAGMTTNNYGYEIFNSDEKTPSRNKIITICLGFPLTIEETQTALICGKVSPLYPRDKRDAIVMMAIKNQYSLVQLNEILFDHGESLFE